MIWLLFVYHILVFVLLHWVTDIQIFLFESKQVTSQKIILCIPTRMDTSEVYYWCLKLSIDSILIWKTCSAHWWCNPFNYELVISLMMYLFEQLKLSFSHAIEQLFPFEYLRTVDGACLLNDLELKHLKRKA